MLRVFFLIITFPWYSGWLVCQNCPKISQWPHFYSKSAIGTMFFEFLVTFLIKMMSHIFIPFLEIAKMTHFRNVPKFAHIPNWWRHTGSCVHFQNTGPIFLDSLIISMSEMVQPYFLELTFLWKLSQFSYVIKVQKHTTFWKFGSDDVIEVISPTELDFGARFQARKTPNWNSSSFVKC